MKLAAPGAFTSSHGVDSRAFLVFLVLIWIAALSGFGIDSAAHIVRHGLDYPLIVHLHALVFFSWLVLFTVQLAFIRSDRVDLHKRLGVAGAALAAVMIPLGIATALTVAARNFANHGETPEFLVVELIDILAFTVFTGGGLLLRGTPAAHKRSMLLGLMYISTPGFARFLNIVLAALLSLAVPLGHGLLRSFVGIFLGPDLLMLGLGIYDLAKHKRLQPVYVAGMLFIALCEATALTLLNNPAWKALSLKLIGH